MLRLLGTRALAPKTLDTLSELLRSEAVEREVLQRARVYGNTIVFLEIRS